MGKYKNICMVGEMFVYLQNTLCPLIGCNGLITSLKSI